MRFQRITALITLAAFVVACTETFAHDADFETEAEMVAEPLELEPSELALEGDFEEKISTMKHWLEQRQLERQVSGEYSAAMEDEDEEDDDDDDDDDAWVAPSIRQDRVFEPPPVSKKHWARHAGKSSKHRRSHIRSAKHRPGSHAHSEHLKVRHQASKPKAKASTHLAVATAKPKKTHSSGKPAKTVHINKAAHSKKAERRRR